jgi:hypothetical protein
VEEGERGGCIECPQRVWPSGQQFLDDNAQEIVNKGILFVNEHFVNIRGWDP